MNKSILKNRQESPLSGDLGVNCELAMPERGNKKSCGGAEM
jgi:hypothetical protein